ncbi:MAG: glycosyltransferase family 4 protein [Sedimentisphaerales bacterium]|nr:glycosyltransferase family 4 protein [Sedimentisphaerales bacterium]
MSKSSTNNIKTSATKVSLLDTGSKEAEEYACKSITFRRRFYRLLWHFIARQFMLLFTTSLTFISWFCRRHRRSLTPDEKFEIMLTGRFDSENWIVNHLGPLSASSECSRLWMVSTNPVPPIPKVTAIYPPKWLMKILGVTQARLLIFLIEAIRKRPHFVGGFHIIVNGIMAIAIGRLTGARSMYFCVGGPAEIRDGGIHSADNSYFVRMETADKVVEKRLLKIISMSDMIVTMGTDAVDFFRDKGIKADFHVVPGGIDSKRFHPTQKKPTIDLIWTGRLVGVKRLDILLHAIKHVTKKFPQVKAAIVGNGKLLDEMRSLSTELEINHNINFVRHQNTIEDWLRDSKIFILTSDSEGLSLSMMEAMMCGLPVVVSEVGDLRDLVDNGVNGYLVPRRSPNLFAERIIELLSNDQKLQEFSRAAHDSAMQYETQATIQHWNNIIAGYRES